MVRTRVGYTGGRKANPTYHDLGDHTESMQVDYDPRVITYDQLLAIFWASHDPAQRAYSEQYKAAVFYANAAQHEAALASLREVERAGVKPVRTQILPLGEFYRAEDYHQKYYLTRRANLWREIEAYYGGDIRELTDSTLAARLNGYAGHFGSPAQLKAELESYGLSPEGAAYVQSLAPALHTDASSGACALIP